MKLNESISVSLHFDSEKKDSFPKWIVWKKRLYPVSRVGLHHTFKKGEVLYHVFSITSKTLFFKLIFNTKNLMWKVEEIANEF